MKETAWRDHGDTVGTPWGQSGNSEGTEGTWWGDCGDITDTFGEGEATSWEQHGTLWRHYETLWGHNGDTLGKLGRPRGHLGHLIGTPLGHLWDTLGTLQGDHGDTCCTCVIAMRQLCGPSVHSHPLCRCHHLCPFLVSPAQHDVGTEGARQEGRALQDTSHLRGRGQGTWEDMGPHRDLAGTRRGHLGTWGGGRVMVRLADDMGMAVEN